MLAAATKQFNNKKDLISWITEGNKVSFLFFWKHLNDGSENIDHCCLSLWYSCHVEVDGICYTSAQHYLMAEKARLFGRCDSEIEIIKSDAPHYATMIGHELGETHEDAWKKHRLQAAVKVNFAKFTQHPELGKYLLSTGDKILVEANPHDSAWGIGMQAEDKKAKTPPRWKGENLLGFSLMQVRAEIQ